MQHKMFSEWPIFNVLHYSSSCKCKLNQSLMELCSIENISYPKSVKEHSECKDKDNSNGCSRDALPSLNIAMHIIWLFINFIFMEFTIFNYLFG